MWSTIRKTENGDSSSNMQMTHRLLISGPKKTGKTSISFRLAYEVASEGSTVLFVCLQNSISGNFPSHVTLVENPVDDVDSQNGITSQSICSSWSPVTLSRIKFKYVANLAEMKRLFASIHTMLPVPHCIVVDDFTLVIDPLSSVSRQDNLFLEVSQVLGK
jgi:DNA polymerase III delta prime subunit